MRLALLRALQLPESIEKHQRIQALTGLISMMIEACPPPLHMVNSNPVRPPSPGLVYHISVSVSWFALSIFWSDYLINPEMSQKYNYMKKFNLINE